MDNIKHVVLLMLENHSFDEMLGCFQGTIPGLDGVDPAQPRSNPDLDGRPVMQKEKTNLASCHDPMHELKNVANQLADNNGGFVKDFASQYKSSTADEHAQIMGYYPRDYLPALHALAKDFTICDRWFSCLPGPTWPNRFFALSGTSSGYVEMPEGLLKPHLATILAQTQKTIFDRLSEKQRSWKIFYYDFPSSLIFANQRKAENLRNYDHIDNFFKKDVIKAEKDFPDFVFIEPKYFGADQNDDHPPHNVMKGEKLIADVYMAIRANKPLWESTLLVVAFDEHGGFYDHVVPPPAPNPDGKTNEYAFDQYGVRVPALLISPWVGRRVEHTQFDHTSLLKYMVDKWGLADLGKRTAAAKSIAVALDQTVPRQDTVGSIRVPFGQLIENACPNDALGEESAYQEGLHVVAAYLDGELANVETSAMSDFVGAAAGAAGSWTRAKAWLGREVFQNLGNLLTDDLHQHRKKRVAKTADIVKRVLAKGAAK